MKEKPGAPTYFTGAFGGCNNDGRFPPGDLRAALHRPGAYFKLFELGEGLAILVPRAKTRVGSIPVE